MEYFYKLVIVLAYIHTYLMHSRCVKKVFLAENEPDPGVKSEDGKGPYEEDVLTEVMNLLSFKTLGEEKVEQEKSEEEGAVGGVEGRGAVGGVDELGAVGGVDELGAVGGVEELGAVGGVEELGAVGGVEELGAVGGVEELGAVGGVEELGAVGGVEELGEVGGVEELGEVGGVEDMETGEKSPRKRRLILRKARFQLENIKKYKGTSEEDVQMEEVKEKGTTSSESSSDDAPEEKPEEKPEEAGDAALIEFKHVLRVCDYIYFEINDEAIDEYLKTRVYGIERISELHKEYPLNLGKAIDFESLRKPFGVADESLVLINETELHEMLYFDDYMKIPLLDFLNNTTVGKLPLTKVNSLYSQVGIKYLPWNNYLLEYLSPRSISFNIDHFFNNNIGTYLSDEKCEICNFDDTRRMVIGEKNKENNNIVEALREMKNSRELSYGERQRLRYIIFYQLRSLAYVEKKLSFFGEKRNRIKNDLTLLSEYFPLPKKYVYKDVTLLTCLHYVSSYIIVILKPLKGKVGKNMIEHRELLNTAALVNHLIAVMEFMENNSQLCQKFFEIYRHLRGFYPRLKSSEDIVKMFNYLMIRRQLFCIMYNIGKLLSKLQYCEDQVTNYEDNIFGDYAKLTFSLERTLDKAKELYKR
ncbi:Uncharacterized protein PCOAH_00047540 [Plasmodium coatneyi]|uniref:KELT protein n=1 Tax=Plasmodium coatneyi TaxID=208452 RepID=A0A1B1E5T9_9APIC|nr:Uncharacterized protein PCOAH_00047540 [Plasmodium coatneyi]ANQ10337.1 Uncharacterized protein PCOAH_00047540 [Plasmodium coatneyi]